MLDANIKTRFKMENVINLGIPHVGEQIFKCVETKYLIKFLEVSEAWKVLAENVLFQRCNGKVQFWWEMRYGEAEIVRIILERSKSEDIELMLMGPHGSWKQFVFLAACAKGLKDVLKLLLAHSIDYNAREESEFILRCAEQEFGKGSALFLACKNGHREIVKLLLDDKKSQNIDFNEKDSCGNTTNSPSEWTGWTAGMTAFMTVCARGHIDIVKLLLDHPNSKNIDINHRSANYVCYCWSPRSKTSVWGRVCSLCCPMGGLGWTVFTTACARGHVDIVKILLGHPRSQNIDINEKDSRGITAFMLACRNRHKDIVKLLLNHPSQTIDINAKD